MRIRVVAIVPGLILLGAAVGALFAGRVDPTYRAHALVAAHQSETQSRSDTPVVRLTIVPAGRTEPAPRPWARDIAIGGCAGLVLSVLGALVVRGRPARQLPYWFLT